MKTAEIKSQERESAAKKQYEKYEREIVLLKSELEAAQIHIKNFRRQLEEKDKAYKELLRSCRRNHA